MVVALTLLVCLIVPLFGFLLCRSANVVSYETGILMALSRWPEFLHDCSTLLAFMFSTGGCAVLLAALAVIDFRFTRSMRTVLGDVIVAASPMVYVTCIKWLVERPRPITAIHSSLLPGDPSFPSGHTAGAVIIATMIILTVRNAAHRKMHRIEEQRHRMGMASVAGTADAAETIETSYRRRAMLGCVVLIIAVATSRLLLGLHFPTDVLTSAIVCPLISYAVWIVREHLREAKTR